MKRRCLFLKLNRSLVFYTKKENGAIIDFPGDNSVGLRSSLNDVGGIIQFMFCSEINYA